MKIHPASSLLLVLCHATCGNKHHAAPEPPPAVEITTENAVDLARTALHAAFGVAEIGNIAGKVVTAVPSMDQPAGRAASVENRLGGPAPGHVALPLLITENLPGAGGGYAVRTLDDRDDEGSVSTGDELSITFVGYVEGLLTLNGSIMLDDIVVQGDLLEGFTWVLAARLHFVNLEITSGSGVESLTGSVPCMLEQRPTVTLLSMQVDADLTLGASTLLPGNTIALNRYPLDFKVARFGAGAIMQQGVDGVVSYETTVLFTGPNGYPYSEAGEMKIMGRFDSCITVTVMDLTNVEITVDVDGDGEVDGTTMLEWSELLNPER
ncbi:MAG TPA: hypothetical protein VFZ65_21150 [Planctomycetota bacterium]|nr:hypothetical protein [Planctomycetota bacterium]